MCSAVVVGGRQVGGEIKPVMRLVVVVVVVVVGRRARVVFACVTNERQAGRSELDQVVSG